MGRNFTVSLWGGGGGSGCTFGIGGGSGAFAKLQVVPDIDDTFTVSVGAGGAGDNVLQYSACQTNSLNPTCNGSSDGGDTSLVSNNETVNIVVGGGKSGRNGGAVQ